MDAGAIYVADLGGETRRHVLVLSNARFHQRSSRVIVAPEWRGAPEAGALPWRIRVEDETFAVDHLRSIDAALLLDEVGVAPYTAVMAAQRALLAIT